MAAAGCPVWRVKMLTTRRTMTRRCKSCKASHFHIPLCIQALLTCSSMLCVSQYLQLISLCVCDAALRTTTSFTLSGRSRLTLLIRCSSTRTCCVGSMLTVCNSLCSQSFVSFPCKASYCFLPLQVLKSLLPFSRRALCLLARGSM